MECACCLFCNLTIYSRFFVHNAFLSKGGEKVLTFEIYPSFEPWSHEALTQAVVQSLSFVVCIMPPAPSPEQKDVRFLVQVLSTRSSFSGRKIIIDTFSKQSWKWKMVNLRPNSFSSALFSTFMICGGKGQMRNDQMLLQDDTCPLEVPPHSFGHFCACQRLIAECFGTFGISTP